MFSAFEQVFTLETALYFAKGALVSLGMAILSLFIGLILGVLGASAKRSKYIVLRAIGNFYVEVIRGTPMLLQILIIFSVIPSIYTAITGEVLRINVYLIGIIAMSNKPVILQGQIEATEIRISGKLPGRIDTFLVKEGQNVKVGDTLVVINSPEAWAKFRQVNALEDIAKYQNKKIDDGTREQIVRSVEELWNKSKSDLQLAKVTYDRIQNLYRDSVVTSQRKDEVEAVYKAAVAAERAAHQQYLLVKDGAQKEDKESARSLVDAARSTVNEVQALLMDARLTAPENGQISTIYPKRGELVGAGTPIMSLVVLDDCHVVLNVREDYMHYFRMNETFRGNVPALKVENIEFKIYYISPLGSFATWRSTKQTGTYDMKTFEIHALPLQPVDGLRPGMSVLVNLNELK